MKTLLGAASAAISLVPFADAAQAQGAISVSITSAELNALIATDRARYAKIIKDKGIKLD